MKKHTVYFEIFGKKMKTTVYAFNKKQAEDFIKQKIIFHKIIAEDKFVDNLFDFLKIFKK